MAEELKVVVGADVNDLLNGLGKARKSLTDFKDQLGRFQSQLVNATDPASIFRLNKAIEATEARIKHLSNLGRGVGGFTEVGNQAAGAATQIGKVAGSSNAAGFALQNLGRVAQDVPFGFIGIQNNLNPLLESFSRVRAETGSAAGAFKVMAGSLMGAGGIGLALSLASSAFLIFQNGIGGFNKKAKEMKESADAVKDSLKSIIDGLSQESVKVDVLVRALENENLTRRQRAEAINQLQKISPAYFANLDKEKATIDQIKGAYDAYTQSILRSIEAKVREKELLDITAQILTLQRKGNELGSRQILVDGKLVNASNQRVVAQGEELSMAEAYQATIRGTIGLTKAENQELDKLLKTRKELLDLVVANKGLDFLNVAPEAAKKAKETIADVIGELARQIDFLNAKGFALNVDQSPEKMSAIFSTIDKLIKDFKVAPDDTIIKKLLGDTKNDLFGKELTNLIQNIDALKLRGELKEKLEDVSKTGPIEISTPIKFDITIPADALDNAKIEMQRRMLGLEDFVAELTQEMEVDIATGIGEALGKALAGQNIKGVFDSLFGGIFQVIGQGLKELGSYLLATAPLFKALKLALKSLNPALQVVAGIQLIALGTLIQAKAAKVGNFAVGVRNFEGGLAMVGERGPELVSLPRGSSVTPAGQTAGMLSGQMIFIPDIRLQGTDLVIAFNRTMDSNNRNF